MKTLCRRKIPRFRLCGEKMTKVKPKETFAGLLIEMGIIYFMNSIILL